MFNVASIKNGICYGKTRVPVLEILELNNCEFVKGPYSLSTLMNLEINIAQHVTEINATMYLFLTEKVAISCFVKNCHTIEEKQSQTWLKRLKFEYMQEQSN